MLSAGLTGLSNLHDGFDLPLPMIRHTRAPHRLWEATDGMSDPAFVRVLADDLEEMILREGPDTVAAFIAEPIQAAGGVIVPPPGYFAAIQDVLRRYDVLLIADEVVCGFGRTGVWFGSELLGIEPDLVTVAKGLTSAYVPLSGCVVVSRGVTSAPTRRRGVRSRVHLHGPSGRRGRCTREFDIIERDGLVDQAASRGERLQAARRRSPTIHSSARCGGRG